MGLFIYSSTLCILPRVKSQSKVCAWPISLLKPVSEQVRALLNKLRICLGVIYSNLHCGLFPLGAV